MTESVRKRRSKWDVAAEPQVPIALGHVHIMPEIANDSTKGNASNSEWNSLELESNSFSVPSAREPDSMMMNQASSEADDFTKSSQQADSGTRIHNERPQSFQLSGPSVMEVHREDDTKQSYEVPLSGEQAAVKDEDLSRVRDKREQSPDQSYGAYLSSGLDAGKQPSPTVSPKKTWESLDRSHRSRSRSRSRSWSRSRGRSSRSRSQSPSYRRGPDRIISRSPPYDSRRGSEQWSGRGRMGAGELAPCRDFAAGRCQRGSECRFRHEESDRRQSGRHHDSAVTATEHRESRFDRGRYSASDSRERIDFSRDKFSRNDRPTGICFHFANRGRCHRGASCRYAHHEASVDGGRNMRDENRERSHDRRDRDSSFDRRLHPPFRVVGVLPCKYFAGGHCNHGESCKFSHQGIVQHDDRSGYNMGIDNNNSSWSGLNRGDHASATDTANSSRWMNNDDSLKGEDSGSKTQHSQSQLPKNNRHQSQPQDASNLLTVASIPGQSFGQGLQNQSVVQQPTQTQNFPATVQIQQLVPPMPLNVQMQPTIFPLPQNMQNQFIAPATQNFNVGMQNLAVLPPPFIGQVPQNYNLPLPHGGQTQLNYNLSTQIQQDPSLPSHHGLNQENLNFGGQSQNALFPPKNGQSQSVSLQPPTNSQSVNSNEQLFDPNGQQMQIGDPSKDQPSLLVSDDSIAQKVVTNEQLAKITNLSASLAQFFGSAINPQVASGAVPVQPNEGSVIQHYPLPIPNMEPVKPDDNHLPLGYVEKDPVSKETQKNVDGSTPSLVTVGVHDNNPPSGSVGLEEKVQQGTENIVPKEENKAETGHDQKEHAGDVDTDPRTDGESKQSKDAKVLRVFKSALVDFVKEVLKPSWKEGHLSKEAHKTIVKKVVEKVTGAMQVSNIPQTPEKIDIYLSHSRVKLTKLVQAYVEKYVKV